MDGGKVLDRVMKLGYHIDIGELTRTVQEFWGLVSLVKKEIKIEILRF